MAGKTRLQQREKELQALLASQGGRNEPLGLVARSSAAAARMRLARASIVLLPLAPTLERTTTLPTSILLPRLAGEQDKRGLLCEPDEVLVADYRNGLTPAQMVEQKFLALLDSGRVRR